MSHATGDEEVELVCVDEDLTTLPLQAVHVHGGRSALQKLQSIRALRQQERRHLFESACWNDAAAEGRVADDDVRDDLGTQQAALDAPVFIVW
eukprot:CAMPEP_0198220918 /NCGR_PEP_ID=MMETSP1445-20131203/81305_1 /TAXON_ID=36898 /ORGANISM="Pyramimonas sp., Strain CCMP2087" /LENGTH=92 /DNA_ID=CAMNT_0043898857 /DNA_START=314 /DNA_END=589 /DNA_ORIENTATION=+